MTDQKDHMASRDLGQADGGVREPKRGAIYLQADASDLLGPISQQWLRHAMRGAPPVLCGESWNLPDAETVEITTTFGLIAEIRQALEGAKP